MDIVQVEMAWGKHYLLFKFLPLLRLVWLHWSVEEQVDLQASPGPLNMGPISRLLMKQPGWDL